MNDKIVRWIDGYTGGSYVKITRSDEMGISHLMARASQENQLVEYAASNKLPKKRPNGRTPDLEDFI